MMKSLQVTAYEGAIQVVDVPIPRPQAGEVLVQIHTCGLCHTDIHILNGDWSATKAPLPMCPGHEGVGIVTELGNNVVGVEVGDRVGIPWLYDTCENCEFCLTGRENLCSLQHNTGFHTPGCFRQFVVAKARHVVPIPVDLDATQAARK